MLSFILKLVIFALNVVYMFFKIFPIKNKIVMMSRQSDKINDDFRLLGEELSKNHEVVYLCKTLDGGIDSTIKTKILYCFHIFSQMYHLATSKVCILDSYSPVVSILKHKKKLVVVQIWHSIGSMKKFGWQILDKKEGSGLTIARAMKMHRNYNVVYASGEAYKKDLGEGFNFPPEKIKIFTLPRIDLIKNQEYKSSVAKRIYEKYPLLNSKKTVIYAPTFRKNESDFNQPLNDLINAFDFSKYNLVVKLHPLSKVNVKNDNVIFDKSFSTFEMLCIADKMISDYSCVIYEAGVAEIPLYFYNYDMSNYETVRGLAIDYGKLPGYQSRDPEELVKSLDMPYDMDYLNDFISKYVENTENCAEKMAKDIESYI